MVETSHDLRGQNTRKEVVMTGTSDSTVKTIVLVHGGFVDGSGWEEVYKILKKDGYTVSIVQNPTISLADDVAVTKRVIATHKGPVILVGHSYGGAVITEAGNDAKVAGLVYSPPLRRTKASRFPRSSRIHHRELPCRRYCHRRTAFCSRQHKIPRFIRRRRGRR